jgi:hypothetical protein
MCNGGVFAAYLSNIKKLDVKIWDTIETSLTRGDNIIEGDSWNDLG